MPEGSGPSTFPPESRQVAEVEVVVKENRDLADCLDRALDLGRALEVQHLIVTVKRSRCSTSRSPDALGLLFGLQVLVSCGAGETNLEGSVFA